MTTTRFRLSRWPRPSSTCRNGPPARESRSRAGSRRIQSSDPRFRRYLTKFGIFRPSRVLYQHTVRYHNPRDLELYAMLRPGEDSIHALERHGRGDLMRYRRDVFDDKYAPRLRGDRPCKTIVAHRVAPVTTLSKRQGRLANA